MRFTLFIALRYFFSSSKQTIVNLINGVSLVVILVSTASLFIVLSAFSGLKTFGLSFSEAFDPDMRISPAQGKTLHVDPALLDKISQLSFVAAAVPLLEDKVFLRFQNKSHVAFLRGVPEDYRRVVAIDSLMGRGQWLDPETSEVVIGNGVAQTLSLGVYDYSHFLRISAPRRKKTTSFSSQPFREEKSIVSGIYFANEEIDKKYLFAPLPLAQSLLERAENEYSSIEIKTTENLSAQAAYKKLAPLFENPVVVRSRAQLNAALYKMLNTENLVIYLIFSLIISIALFTVVGSVSMMFLDKKEQLSILLAMGLLPAQIQTIFFLLGGLISWLGGAVGLVLACILVWVQEHYPFISVPGTSLPYPVEFEAYNLGVVVLTVFGLGLIASFWSTRGIDQKVVGQTKA